MFVTPIQPASETLLETLNNFKPTLMQALKGNTYLSELHKMLDEKSKCRFYDIIALHPRTSVDYTVKETAACLVSQWYKEHLETQLRPYSLRT